MLPDKFSFTGKKPACLFFLSPIHDQSAAALIAALAKAARRHDEILLLFTSPGGETDASITIHHFIKALKIPVAIHSMGCIESVGNVVYQAGHRRSCTETSYFRFSKSTGLAIEEDNGRFSGRQAHHYSSIQRNRKAISDFMVRGTNLKPDDLEKLLDKEETIEARDAVALGVADEAKDRGLPKGLNVTVIKCEA